MSHQKLHKAGRSIPFVGSRISLIWSSCGIWILNSGSFLIWHIHTCLKASFPAYSLDPITWSLNSSLELFIFQNLPSLLEQRNENMLSEFCSNILNCKCENCSFNWLVVLLHGLLVVLAIHKNHYYYVKYHVNIYYLNWFYLISCICNKY